MKLDNRIWILITVVIVLALGAGGWFLGVSPQLAALGDAQDEQAEVDLQNQTLQAEIDQLRLASADMENLRAQAEDLQLAVPDEMDSSEFIDSLTALAAQTQVTVSSIGIDSAQIYIAPAPDATVLEGAPTPTTNGLITSDNFVVIPVSIKIRGDYGRSLDFVDGLQTGLRLILVHELTITRTGDEGAATFETTVNALVYALPGSALPPLSEGTTAAADTTEESTDS